MLKIYLAFWKSEPQYAYKRYVYKKHVSCFGIFLTSSNLCKYLKSCPKSLVAFSEKIV